MGKIFYMSIQTLSSRIRTYAVYCQLWISAPQSGLSQGTASSWWLPFNFYINSTESIVSPLEDVTDANIKSINLLTESRSSYICISISKYKLNPRETTTLSPQWQDIISTFRTVNKYRSISHSWKFNWITTTREKL